MFKQYVTGSVRLGSAPSVDCRFGIVLHNLVIRWLCAVVILNVMISTVVDSSFRKSVQFPEAFVHMILSPYLPIAMPSLLMV